MTNDEARALIEAGRKHDEAMADGPWEPSEASPGARRSEVRSIDPCHPDYDMRVVVTGGDNESVPVNRRDAVPNANGIAWMRTNLRALLEGYSAAIDAATSWENAAMLLRSEAIATLETSNEYHRRHLEAMTENDRLRALNGTLAKQQQVTQYQLDKFMSACADQAIQIMELRGEVRDCRDDVKAADERMAGVLDGTFAVGDGTAQREIECLRAENVDLVAAVSRLTMESVERGARVRDMADRIDLMRHVVEAADAWQTCTSKGLGSHKERALYDAVNALRSRSAKP